MTNPAPGKATENDLQPPPAVKTFPEALIQQEKDNESAREVSPAEIHKAEEKEVEDGKKWLENQFEGAQQQQHEEYSQFTYGQPLDQILEEEEDRYSYSSEDMKELQRFKESLSSTPDFDQIEFDVQQGNKVGPAIILGILERSSMVHHHIGQVIE